MSIYFEKARELGTLILESQESKDLADAGAAFDADEAAKAKLEGYKDYHFEVQSKMSAGELSQEDITKESQKLAEMAMELKTDPIIAGLIFAEDNFNTLVSQVMNILKATMSGSVSEDGCGGSCAGCAGCSPQ